MFIELWYKIQSTEQLQFSLYCSTAGLHCSINITLSFYSLPVQPKYQYNEINEAFPKSFLVMMIVWFYHPKIFVRLSSFKSEKNIHCVNSVLRTKNSRNSLKHLLKKKEYINNHPIKCLRSICLKLKNGEKALHKIINIKEP